MPLDYSSPDGVGKQHDTLRILIVDDHTLIADMLELFLGQLDQAVRVFKATSMPQALALARAAGGLDLAVLDLHMPDMDGLAGLRHLRAEYPDLPIAIMSGDATAEAASNAMAAGANGFIPKTIGGPAILRALRQILAGERYTLTEQNTAPRPSADATADLGLSPRERDVLAQLTEGLPNKEIARRLGIEVVTVALHLTHIYRKLGVNGRTQAVRRALELHLDRPPTTPPSG
jgi:two-component system, NarL family, nitrate/nitrite response regulator NarL